MPRLLGGRRSGPPLFRAQDSGPSRRRCVTVRAPPPPKELPQPRRSERLQAQERRGPDDAHHAGERQKTCSGENKRLPRHPPVDPPILSERSWVRWHRHGYPVTRLPQRGGGWFLGEPPGAPAPAHRGPAPRVRLGVDEAGAGHATGATTRWGASCGHARACAGTWPAGPPPSRRTGPTPGDKQPKGAPRPELFRETRGQRLAPREQQEQRMLGSTLRLPGPGAAP